MRKKIDRSVNALSRVIPDERSSGLIGNKTEIYELAQELTKQGFGSAYQIQCISEEHFVEQYAKPLSLSEAYARKLHRNAVKASAKALNLFVGLQGTAGSSCYQGTRGNTTGEETTNFLNQIPSYQDIFGEVEFCGCDHCKSVFGPAAYYVDLMRIIDQYITQPFLKKIPAGYTLDNRRPDLGELRLTCANTNQEIPYIRVTIQRMEEILSHLLKTADLYEEMNQRVYPFSFPFQLPLQQIRGKLEAAGTSLAKLYQTWQKPLTELTAERLQMSPTLFKQLYSPMNHDILMQFYGLNELKLSELSEVTKFLEITGLSKNELQLLITQGLTAEEWNKELARYFYINQDHEQSSILSIGKDGKLQGLTEQKLQNLVRFIRLSKSFSLSYDSFDWMLRLVGFQNESCQGITLESLKEISQLLAITESSGIKPEELSAMVGPLKTYGDNCAYQKIFGGSEKVYQPVDSEKYPLNPLFQDAWISWHPVNDLPTSSWLAGCLHTDLQSLQQLAELLFPNWPIPLNLDNLSALYRHSRLASLLGYRIAEYGIWRRLCHADKELVFTQNSLSALLDHKRLGKINLYQAQYIIEGVETVYAGDPFTVDMVTQLLDTISRKTLPEKQNELVASELAIFFSTDQTTIEQIAFWAPPIPDLLKPKFSRWQQAFLLPLGGTFEKEVYNYVTSLLSAFAKCRVLADCGIPLPLLRLAGEWPGYFGLISMDKLTMEFLELLFDAVRYGEKLEVSYEQMMECYIQDKQGFDFEQLALLLDRPSTDIQEIWNIAGGFQSFKTPAEQLHRLVDCIQLLDQLQVSVAYIMKLLVFQSLPFSEAKRLAAGVEEVEGLERQKRDACLNLLITNMRRSNPDLNTADHIYQFLLMDVQMDEAMKISYVKEGINALQLYLHRCRMGLEPGIGKILIPESWWSWIMSYPQWEANRRIFVYPENYLLPSVRQTKTRLFKDVEEALQQANIDNGYIEEQYIKYLDSYSDLAQIKPCAAYAADVDAVSVLYLFGRTKNEPYEYYFCQQEDGLSWSEWERIDVKISSEYITPIYVFNRLYLLWVEQKIIPNPSIGMNGNQVESKNQVSSRLDIKYTFRNLQNQWVVPQTLLQDLVVCHEIEGNPLESGQSPFSSSFDMEKESWKKVTALRLTNRNFQDKNGGEYLRRSENYERLFIMVGSFLYNFGEVNESLRPEFDPKGGSDKYQADRHKAKLLDHLNLANALQYSGHMQAGITKLFNEDMEEDYFVDKNEYLLFDSYYYSGGTFSVKPVLDEVTNTVGVQYTRDVLLNTAASVQGSLPSQQGSTPRCITPEMLMSYTFSKTLAEKTVAYLKDAKVLNMDGSFQEEFILEADLYDIIKGFYFNEQNQLKPSQFLAIQTALLDCLNSVELFRNKEVTKITPVNNQPGWFIYDCSDETFLIMPDSKELNLAKTDSSLMISYPRLSYVDFSSLGFSSAKCDMTFRGLKNGSIIDEDGFLFEGQCSLENVTKVLQKESVRFTDKDLLDVYELLHNRHIATNRIFASDHISVDKSNDIFCQLTGTLIQNVDSKWKWKPVCIEKELQKKPKDALNKYVAEFDPVQLSQIFDLYLRSPVAVGMLYHNPVTDTAVPLTQCSFHVIRLTNAAIKKLKNRIYLGGINRFLSLDTQNTPVIPIMPFDRLSPNPKTVQVPKAMDGMQVDFEGLYKEYNWELFYHIPMLIAQNLQYSQLNELAKKWYEYVFKPNTTESFIYRETEGAYGMDTFTRLTNNLLTLKESEDAYTVLESAGLLNNRRVKYEFDGILSEEVKCKLKAIMVGDSRQIELKLSALCNILANYALSSKNSFYWQFKPFRNRRLEDLIEALRDDSPEMIAYNNHPFNPHAIAGLRNGAYEKFTVMAYIQNLIDWGDQQFSQYTWESITSATMMYVLASDLLGPYPKLGKANLKDNTGISFNKIKELTHGKIPQFLINLETQLDGHDCNAELPEEVAYQDVSTLFGIPENKQLISLWDIIEDRLYKIRHAMDINGVVRSLRLFESPLDPMQLARASSLAGYLPGQDIAKGLEPNHYRFQVLVEQAVSLTSQLIQLGSQLLSAQERNDGESLQMLVNTQERTILNLMSSVKKSQIDDLAFMRDALQSSRQQAQERKDYYKKQADEFMSSGEITSFSTMVAASAFSLTGSIMKTAAGSARLAPQVGSPFAMKYGGVELGSSLDTLGSAADLQSGFLSALSNCASVIAGYKRRQDEWRLQEKIAELDGDGLERQLEAAICRLAAAEQDYSAHLEMLKQKGETAEFFKNKFSNAQLYQWMSGRLRGTMLQCYQLALEMSVRAQAAYQQECNSSESFLTFQYWDSGKNGLLSGESLMMALNQMKASYLNKHERYYEIEKNISLARECPMAFAMLKATGSCQFQLTEEMFAYDYPNAYARRIKAVSVSIPALLGPYQTIHATLTQEKNAVLMLPNQNDDNAIDYMLNFHDPDRDPSITPDGIIVDYNPWQRISLSKGIDDSGMFVLNFNDERYLPFEGTGVVSGWRLEMPFFSNHFDFNGISDVIVNVKYTAQENAAHGKKVIDKLKSRPQKGGLYMNLRQSCSAAAWQSFLAGDGKGHTLVFPVGMVKSHHGEMIQLSSLVMRFPDDSAVPDTGSAIRLVTPDGIETSVKVKDQIGAAVFKNPPFEKIAGDWKLTIDKEIFKKECTGQLAGKNELNKNLFDYLEMILIYERRVKP